MEDILLPFLVVAVNVAWALFFAWVLWLGLRRRSERHAAAIELRKRALDKFSSAAEFIEFLGTPGGARFLEPAESRWRVRAWVLFGTTVGLILLFVGIAFSVLSEKMVEELLIPGLLCGAVGLGLLISSFVAHRLAKAWGEAPPIEIEAARHPSEAA